MSCFELPKAICRMFRQIIADEWWGREEGKKKIHWRSWDWLTTPKSFGGMGFRDLEIFNVALLSRQAWRLLQEPESLSARILKAVYYPSTTLLEAELGPHPSQVWRAIIDGRNVLNHGIIRRIGDGATTRIWHHNWLSRSGLMKPFPHRVADPPLMVSDLIEPTWAGWRAEVVRQVFV